MKCFYSSSLSTAVRHCISRSRRSQSVTILFILSCFWLKIKFLNLNSKEVHSQEQELILPPRCIASAEDTGVKSEFTLKKGWRTSCGKDFEVIVEKDTIDNYWDKVLFLRPIAVVEGFTPSPNDLGSKTIFEEYRKYGNFAEFALRNLFEGKEIENVVGASLKTFESCLLVVATASFGGQDTLHQPLHIEPRHGVCYVAFIDAETRRRYDFGECEKTWNVIELPKLVWGDPRMKTRIVRALLPFYFPYSTFSVWIDSSLR